MGECSCGYNHDRVRKQCQESILFTAKFLCGFPDPTDRFHGSLAKRLEKQVERGGARVGYFLPRGHLKTHVLNLAFSVNQIIKDRNIRILSIQGSASKATENLRTVRSVLESEKLRHFFPEIIPGDTWNDDEVYVKRDRLLPEPTYSARGINSKITGGHFDLIIPDDLIGEDNCMSDAEMDRCLRWIKNINPLFVNPILGNLIVIGTRWPNDKAYQYVYEAGGFDITTAGVYIDERCEDLNLGELGNPIWPERYGHEALEKIKSTTPPFEWSHQYLNQPVTEAFRRFPASCLQYYTWLDGYETLKYSDPDTKQEKDLKVSTLYRVLTVDPAASGAKTADESAISVSGKADFARFFVLEDFGARLQVSELVDKIIELWQKWKPHVVGIEKGAFMHVLKPFIELEQSKRGIYFPVVQLDGQIRNKVKRIDSLQPFFQGRQVWMGRAHKSLEGQLLAYAPVEYKDTGLPHDDRLDALAYHTKYWRQSSFQVEEDEDRIRTMDETDVDRWYGLECVV